MFIIMTVCGRTVYFTCMPSCHFYFVTNEHSLHYYFKNLLVVIDHKERLEKKIEFRSIDLKK